MNLFQKVLNGESVKTPPVWMMRQAGRYHSHYQALRKKHSFIELCLQPELAVEVAMGPILDFDFDAAILFSDLLFPLKSLGMGLDYTEAGPQLGFKLNEENFKTLIPWQEAWPEMGFQKEALKLTRRRLAPEKALIGFVGGPWTLFVYATEGTHSGNLLRAKTSWPLWQKYLKVMEPFLIENIRLQLEGGADLVMIFDTAAGELSPDLFQNQVQPSLANLAKSFPGKLAYYSKNTGEDFFENPSWDSIPWVGQGYDHRRNLPRLLKNNKRSFVQGNFDQVLLHLSADEFQKHFENYLRTFSNLDPHIRKSWVCGLGHGVLPQTPEANVRKFVEIVRRTFV